MTSLRVALKLSMAEAKPDEKKRKNPLLVDRKVEEPSLDDILSGRKRRASFERQSRQEKPPRLSTGPRSESPADESLAGRSEGSGFYAESNSIITEDPSNKATFFEDHESIASMKGDDNSIADDLIAERPNSRLEKPQEFEHKPIEQMHNLTTSPDKEHEEADIDAEDADTENAENMRAAKKKRKRTSSILRSLEPINGKDPTPVNDDENLPRYQSSRAAAMVAKTKISTKGVGGRSNSLDDLGAEIAVDTKLASKDRRRKSGAGAAAVKLNWVQCDQCSKWRSVAAHVNENDLPEKWFCSMNTWDAHLSNCTAPEEEEPTQPPSTASAKSRGPNTLEDPTQGDGAGGEGGLNSKNQHRVWVRAGNGGRGRWRRTGDQQQQQQDGRDDGGQEGDEPEDGQDDSTAALGGATTDEPVVGVASRRRSLQAAQGGGVGGGSPRAPSGQTRGGGGLAASVLPNSVTSGDAAATAPVDPAAVNWVQCNKCRKWRKVPESIDVDSLPDRWYCSLNTWAPAFARCNAKQEVDEVVATAPTTEAATAVPANKGVSRGRRVTGTNGNNSNNASNGILPPGTIRQVSWVQCERRNCKKWRKVPATIDIDSLPEKWYCEMNSWDMDSATCDAPEASDSENEQSSSALSRQQLILANSKGANALSYRRIIFGTDGRIRVCFSDKNKNGYGIFSYSEAHKPSNDADDYTAPTRRVGYWWSGAYDESAGAAAAAQSSGRVSGRKEALAVENTLQDSAAGTDVARSAEPSPPTYLLDTARRMYDMQAKPLSFSWPKKVSKSWTLLSKMPLFRRQNLECTVVMSCFLSAATPQLMFTKLLYLIETRRFADPEVEACREFMSSEGLKAVVKRLEDRGLVEVSFTNAGQLTVDVVPSVAQLAQNCSARGVLGAAAACGINPAWCKQGLPLKLRKFYNDSKYKEGSAEQISQTATQQLQQTVPAATIADTVKLAARTISAREEHSVVESMAAVSVSTVPSSSAAPLKPFRLQHRERWSVPAPTQTAE